MRGVGHGLLLTICILGAASAGCDGPGAEADEEPGEQVAASGAPAASSLPAGITAEVAEEGRKLFVPCAVCHGLDGLGNQLGPSLRDGEWVHISGSLEEIETIIRDGVAEPENYPVPMAPMGGGDFDAQQLRAVASYVYAISARAAAPAPAPAPDSAPPPQ